MLNLELINGFDLDLVPDNRPDPGWGKYTLDHDIGLTFVLRYVNFGPALGLELRPKLGHRY